MLDQEGGVEADENEPEGNLSEPLVQEATRHLRKPVVDPGEDREYGPAEDRVVEVGDDEVGVVELPVHGEDGEEYAGDPADGENRDHAHREVQGGRGHDRSSP